MLMLSSGVFVVALWSSFSSLAEIFAEPAAWRLLAGAMATGFGSAIWWSKSDPGRARLHLHAIVGASYLAGVLMFVDTPAAAREALKLPTVFLAAGGLALFFMLVDWILRCAAFAGGRIADCAGKAVGFLGLGKPGGAGPAEEADDEKEGRK